MSISKTVRISELYPTGIEDLSKPFRSVSDIPEPYRMDAPNSNRAAIKALVAEIEKGKQVADHTRRHAPYSSELDRIVDAVNAVTTNITDDPDEKVPEDIRWIQLAHFHHPEVDGRKYSYGIMMHYRNVAAPPAQEFAILLPYERDKDVPALVLRNNFNGDSAQTLCRITKAIRYSRQQGQ